MINKEVQHERVLGTKVKMFTICKVLGSGASSIVYLAVNSQSKLQVAIKVIPKQYLNQDKKLMELVTTQIYVLKSCNNQNVVKCFEVFQSKLSIFIVMEYCNGLSMEQYIKRKKYLSQDHAVWFLKQILNGFKGLHQIGAMHRDFKLANLLLHERGCKIADLGFAKQMKEHDLTETVLGTYVTMAPEVLEKKPYGMGADIWSLGVVFYQMLTGKYPYIGSNGSDLLKNIKSKQNDFSNLRISKLAKNFIQGCLTEDPALRITWVHLYNHPLLNKTSVELVYGISKTNQVFVENQQFYKRQSLSDSDKLALLRNSARKEVIIQQFQQMLQCKAAQCDNLMRTSMQSSQITDQLITYGVNYGAYLNQLSYPLKFFSLEIIQKVPNVDHFTPLYFICKKSYIEIQDFLYILQKRINIFKISKMWNHFIKSRIYNDVISIVRACEERARYMYQKIHDHLSKSSIVQKDERIKQQLADQGIKRNQFLGLLQEYKNKYLRDLFEVLLSNSQQNNIQLIDLCSALLYYSDSKMLIYYSTDKQSKTQSKKKMSPERFDWNHTKSINYKQARLQLIQNFKKILA